MLNIQVDLPKLRMSNSQTRSQVSNVLSARHKNKASFDSFFEKTDLISTPNRIRKKDNLSIIDEALDAKEIFFRNSTTQDYTQEFTIYKEHLDQLAVYVKNSNPILAFSINRGVSGCNRVLNHLEKLIGSLQSKPLIVQQSKKLLRDCQVQTVKVDEESEWKMINKKDIKIFKRINQRLEELNLSKITQKLREMQKSLKKAYSEVPGLSKFPELGSFNIKDTVSQLEKHVKNIQQEVSSEFTRRKLAALPKSVNTQTEVPLIDPEKFFVLEKMLIEKEEEIFDSKKKIQILGMEKKNLLEKFETSQSCLYQVEQRLYKAREKEAKFDRLEEEKVEEKKRFEQKLMKNRAKLLESRNQNMNHLRCLEKQREMMREIVEEYKEARVQGKVAEIRLEEIKRAWEVQFGEGFKFTAVNIKEIRDGLNLKILEKFDEIFEKSKNGELIEGGLQKSLAGIKGFTNSPGKSEGNNHENGDFQELGTKSSGPNKKKSFNRLATQSFIRPPKNSALIRQGSIDPKTGRPFTSSSPNKVPSSPNKNSKSPQKLDQNLSEASQDSLNCENFPDHHSSSTKNSTLQNQNFLSRLENKLKHTTQPSKRSYAESDLKFSGVSSTQFTDESSAESYYKRNSQDSHEILEGIQNPSEIYEALIEKLKNGEKLTKLQEKFLQLYQGNSLKNLIKEDPEEYLKHTFTLFDPNDELHAKLLQEFPTIAGIPKKVQFEIFSLMMEHEKMRCHGGCKHLQRVHQLKYRIKGIPYPIRKKTVEF